MHDQLDDISVFVEAAEAGGFSPAALKLNLTRSAVGKAVARLESRLGTRLFHRTTRTQSLTDDGLTFFEHCRRGLGEIRAGRNLIESGRHAVSGRLRVSVSLSFGRRCVAPVLLPLTRLHPDLLIDIDFTDRPVDLVEEGFDLAIRSGKLADSGDLMARLLMRQSMMLVAAPAYLDRVGRPECLDDLKGHACLVYRRQGTNEIWRFPAADGLAELSVFGRIGLDDIEAIAAAAAESFGIAYLPCWLVRGALREGTLVEVLPDATVGRQTDIHALWPRAPYLPARVRVAIDLLAEKLPSANRP